MKFAKKILPLVISTILFGTAYADDNTVTTVQPTDQAASATTTVSTPATTTTTTTTVSPAGNMMTKHVTYSNIMSHSSEMPQQDCEAAFKEGDVMMKDHVADNTPEDVKISDMVMVKGFRIDNMDQEVADANGNVHRVWVGESHMTTKDGEKVADFRGEADVKKDGSQPEVKGHITISKVVDGNPVQLCTADFDAAQKM